jgi:activator of HSP90 ATPase
MPTESIELSRFLPAPPERIYLAWLNGPDHSAMTGGKATVESIEVGGAFSAWDGYIDGVHVALEPGRRIVQTWRTDDFPADATESYLEVRLEPAPGGTHLTIRHTEIPEGQGPAYLAGWDEHYLAPMARFFGAEARRLGRKQAPAKRAPRAGASRRSRPAVKATGRQASGRSGSRPARKPRRQATRTPRR